MTGYLCAYRVLWCMILCLIHPYPGITIRNIMHARSIMGGKNPHSLFVVFMRRP